jgi:hypothetical protein
VAALPRATDYEQRIRAIQAEQARLLASLKGTSLNLKTFLPLFIQHKVSDEFPSYYSYRYLHEKAAGREELRKLDAGNRANLEQYIRISTPWSSSRASDEPRSSPQAAAQNAAAGSKTIDAEVLGVRSATLCSSLFRRAEREIGLGIKKRAPAPFTFIAGYTNGYIYYTPPPSKEEIPATRRKIAIH